MKRKTRHRITIGLFVPAMVLGGASFAADEPYGQGSTATPSSSADATGAPSASASRDGSASAEAITQARSMRASKIIGKDVQNGQGDKLGEIKDLVIDTNGERVQYAVLSHGGVAGIGDKLFAFPMSMVQARADSDDLVINVTKDKLENAPGFESRNWPSWSDNQYSGEIDRYYGASSRVDGQSSRQMVRASELIGKNIDDQAGKSAGEIDDLIVDVSSARVQYAVVDFDDSWSKEADGKLVALPLKSLSVPADLDQKVVLDVPRERLDMSYAFQENAWPNFSDPAWRESMQDRQASVTR